MDEIRRRLEGRTDRTDRTDGDRVLLDDYPNYEDDEGNYRCCFSIVLLMFFHLVHIMLEF